MKVAFEDRNRRSSIAATNTDYHVVITLLRRCFSGSTCQDANFKPLLTQMDSKVNGDAFGIKLITSNYYYPPTKTQKRQVMFLILSQAL